MRKAMLLLMGAVLAFVFFSDIAKAYEIYGTIYDSAGKGIPDVWVELLDDDYGLVTRMRTDMTGRYSFKNLPYENDYIIRVLTDGIHIGQERRVEVGRDTATAHETTDFYLKSHPEFEATKGPAPKKQATAAPGVAGPPAANEVFVQEVPSAARKAYEKGLGLLDSDPESGRLKLKEAIDLFPDYFAALERYGVECVKAGQREPAIDAITRAIAVNPRSHVSYYALGVAQFQLRRYPEAIDSLGKMFLMAPDSPNGPFAHYCLGIALVKTGKPSEAEPQLKQASQEGARDIPSDVHLALAQIYSNTNRYAEAANEIEQLLQREPTRGDAASLRQLIQRLRAKAQ
jgi:tetratricopeptide (TPR) repeat protein